MYNNQNDNSKSKWCPNVFFEKGSISIGEFKTLDVAMGFPIPDKWCVNRTVGDNKFEKYMALNVRVLIICDWSKSIQDSRKFVIALVYPDGQTIYFDFNDIQIDANEYETSLDEDVFNAIERVVSAHYKLHNSETNENKQHKTRYNMKKTIRLSESDLHKVIKESVKRAIHEGYYGDLSGDYDDGFYELQMLYVIFKTLEQLNDMSESILRGGGFGDNTMSALYQIKKAYEALASDKNRIYDSRFDGVEVSLNVSGLKR